MVFKQLIPLILAFIIGLIGFSIEFVSHPWSGKVLDEISSGFNIVSGFALLLGAYSLLHMHVARIRRTTAGWGYSVFVFIGAAGMIALGLWNGGLGPFVPAPSGEKTSFDWAYRYIQVPCAATIFSILAFFMASAAFRTFRARNVGAALLLTAAIIVMFGRAPISDIVGGWIGAPSAFSRAADSIMDYPNLAAQRGIMLGIGLGAISQSIRILFGIERSYLGGSDE
jgi:hypothetical protein